MISDEKSMIYQEFVENFTAQISLGRFLFKKHIRLDFLRPILEWYFCYRRFWNYSIAYFTT
jgi:hypothetical protein